MTGTQPQAGGRPLATTGRLATAGLLALVGGCGDGNTAPPGFVLTETGSARLFLNTPIRLVFSRPVAEPELAPNRFRLSVFDADTGQPLDEPWRGSLRFGRDENGEDRRVVELAPAMPTDPGYTNGGFRPRRRYRVDVAELRDADGRLLLASSRQVAEYWTPSGTTLRELFFDPQDGPPRLVGADVTPIVGDRIGLGGWSAAPVEVRLRFDQPLDPSPANVPFAQDLDPRRRDRRDHGHVWLSYDDVEHGPRTWIPTACEIERNELDGATVVLRPDGVLPNNAEVRVHVEPELRDLSGTSHQGNAGYQPIVHRFRTEEAAGPRLDALMVAFEDEAMLDPEAPIRDPMARLEDGLLTASLGFDGLDAGPFFDFEPTSRELILNTDFGEAPVKNGPPQSTKGGVVSFHDVTIRDGIVVRGIGTNPLVLRATGDVRIDGWLHADGGDGADGLWIYSGPFPTGGGQGVCSGGNGGKGSPNTAGTSLRGESGSGPHQRAGGGGEGGRLACEAAGTYAGSGGGGGSHVTKGDPDYYAHSAAPTNGTGGQGSDPRGPLPGGAPGPSVLGDADPLLGFWGRTVDASGSVRIGALASPTGGAGGGGGGNQTSGLLAEGCVAPNWMTDDKGGGGGGGAGVLVIQALGRITIGGRGRISADGGRGGGGANAGSCRWAGGGGGGSGGMVVLMSATGIDIHAHGETWAKTDASFAVSADGAIGRNTSFGNPQRIAKYPKVDGAPNAGGFGGLGVVQLMTPPGDDADGTGTRYDDRIRILDAQGNALPPAEKKRYLFRGDIRPDPVLMPVTFGRFAAAQTRWIDLGAVVRREAASGPRRTSGRSGPEFYFTGLELAGPLAGYLAIDPATGQPVVELVRFTSGQTRQPVQRVELLDDRGIVHLAPASLPVDAQLGHHVVRFFGSGATPLHEAPLVGHDNERLIFDRQGFGLLASQVRSIEVASKLLEVETEGTPGLGSPRLVGSGPGKRLVPRANLRLGFAFHRDPARPARRDAFDDNRYPLRVDGFVHDLESVRETIRSGHYPFVRFELRWNLGFDPDDSGTGPLPPMPLDTPAPGLRWLRLPLWF